MKFQITAAGLAAAFAASNNGPKLEVVKFQVGDGFGYEPSAAETGGIHGALLYEGTPTGYLVIDDDTCEYTLLMDESIGTFLFGEVALIMPGGATLALGALQEATKKIAYPNQDFNRFKIKVRLQLTGITPVITWVVENLTTGVIVELPTVEHLVNPLDADVNAYICHSSDEIGNDPVCTASTGRWHISTHQHLKFSGTVTSVASDGKSIVSTVITAASEFPLGRYLIQFKSGVLIGTLRIVSNLTANGANWITPVSGLFAGDEFEILQSNTSFSSDDSDALFFALLMKAT